MYIYYVKNTTGMTHLKITRFNSLVKDQLYTLGFFSCSRNILQLYAEVIQ
jgi:hypothetical protein